MTDHRGSDEAVDQETRKEMLDRDNHECQVCGITGSTRGGFARLQIHHKERDLEEEAEHDPANLITLCRHCHGWLHHKPTADDVETEILPADRPELLPQDFMILAYLETEGPASTGDIVEAVGIDQSRMTIRERLYVLMGLDSLVDERDTQIVDKDAETDKWGLTEDIDVSARGRIPDSTRTLLKRAEDEQIRLAIAAGYDRPTVADVFDFSYRTTWRKERRAHAFQLPLTVLYGQADVGRAETRSDAADQSAGQRLRRKK